jgi:hypothetical protein
MSDLSKQFAAIAASSDHKAKNEKYKEVMNKLLSSGDISGLKQFVDHSKTFTFRRLTTFRTMLFASSNLPLEISNFQ